MLDEQWLAEKLRGEGLVDETKLSQAQQDGTGDLCRDLIANGAIQEPELLRFLGLQFQTRYLSTEKLSSAKVLQWVLNLLPMDFCEEHHVLPVRCDKQRTKLSVVTPDPTNKTVLTEISTRSKVKDVLAYVALPHAIEAGIRKFYRGDLHAFARMDESLRQNYSELLNIYEQRLIDFDGDGEAPPVEEDGPVETFRHDELVIGDDPNPVRASSPTEDIAIVPPAQAAQARSPSTILPVGGTGPMPVQPSKTPSGVLPPSAPATGALPAQMLSPAGPLPAMGLMQVVEVLVTQMEQGQGWRAGHSSEVARLAGQMAGKANLPSEAAADLHLAALLHELGKPTNSHLTTLSITADASLRNTALQIYQAPCSLLGVTQIRPEVVQILANLYERIDGSGVPGQASGEKIPQAARLLQVADAFCDLVSNPQAPGGRCDPETALKRLKEAAGENRLDSAAVQSLTNLLGETTATGGGRSLVLIIDEDARSAAVLEGQLKQAGFDAVVANTTGDAALVLLGEQVSLVLSEVELKPMDGFTFLQWLRSNQRTSNIPFMFVSGRADANDVNRGFELGAVDYIVKPFRPEVVLAKVKRTVQ